MNVSEIISADNKRQLRFSGNRYDIEVIDVADQQVLHHRTNTSRYHTCGTFTDDENIVIYITVDYRWYLTPEINIWDLKTDTLKHIDTKHHFQELYFDLSYHKTLQRIALGGRFGNVSAYDMKTHEELWCQETDSWNVLLSLDFSDCGDKIAALQKDQLTVYDFTTGNIRLSVPLADEYSTCEFQEEDLCIHVSHPEKETIRICCKDIIF